MSDAFQEVGAPETGDGTILHTDSIIETSGEAHRAIITSVMKSHPHYSPQRRSGTTSAEIVGVSSSEGPPSPPRSPDRSLGSLGSRTLDTFYDTLDSGATSGSEYS